MGKTMALGWTALLAALILILISSKNRERFGDWLMLRPMRIWIPSVVFLSFYALISAVSGGSHFGEFCLLILYFGTPTMLLYWVGPIFTIKSKIAEELTLSRRPSVVFDLLLVALLWLPVELSLVQKGVQFGERGFKYPLVAFSAIVMALTILPSWRAWNLDCDWKFSKRGWAWMFGVYLAFFAVILPVAWQAGFIKDFGVNPKIFEKQPEFLANLPDWSYVTMVYLILVTGMFFAPGFAEELIFRGLIQNRLMSTRLGNAWGWILASLIFGFAHINNRVGDFRVPNWTYVVFASVAGLGYGLVYWRTRSLVLAAILHALVDTTWLVFFKNGGGR